MAVDSKYKRTSAANLPFMTLFPAPLAGIDASDRIMASGEYPQISWVSADTVEDEYGPGYWNDVNNAKDGNTATYAEEASGAALRDLLFTWNSLYPVVQLVRWWTTHDDASATKVTITYRQSPGASWNAVVTSSSESDGDWGYYPIATGSQYKTVYQIRVVSADATAKLRVHEVQVLDLRGTVTVGAKPLVDGTYARTTVLGRKLVQ